MNIPTQPGCQPKQASTDLPDNFQMTELGPLPEEWRVVRLGEVALLERGVSWSRSDENPNGIGVLSIPDILDGGALNLSPRVRLSKDVPSQKLLAQDDILLVGSSGAIKNIGRPGWVKEKPLKPTTFASFTIRLRAWSENLSQRFVFYLIQSSWIDFSRFSKRAADGKFNLQLLQLKSALIPLPPLDEQRAIAHVLRTVQRAKEATEGVIAALKELKKSLMQHLFTYGPVPVTERERLPLQETELGPLPAHWRVVRLGEVLQLMRNGLTYRQERNPKGVPVTRIETISEGSINPNKVGYISDLDKSQVEKYRLLPGDILFSHINSEPHLGKTAIYQGNPPLILHGMNLLLLRAHPSVSDPYFLFYFLNHERAKGTFIGIAARAVGQSSINMGKLRNLPIFLPPLDEQREIARALQAVDARLVAEQARRAALEELFKSLLHHLMTGKVGVQALDCEEGG